jgi:hypothetical protein
MRRFDAIIATSVGFMILLQRFRTFASLEMR